MRKSWQNLQIGGLAEIAGYEIGVHVARALANECWRTLEAILLLDFENAFNTVDRNLILLLAVAHIPEAAKLFRWLYHTETILITTEGDEVRNSAGVQQGCPLASLSFALVIKWLVEQLKHTELSQKIFFHDDGLLKGSPEALGWAAKFFDAMTPVSGLKMKWCKTVCHAPGMEVARRCSLVLPKEVQVFNDMNMKFLKAPIGSNEWVNKELDEKLKELKIQIDQVSRMPYLHEAFTLLRQCSTVCKVNHLTRTLPPAQLIYFLQGFDAAVRKGFETLLGVTLTDRWWRAARLPAKFGGFGLRTGITTAGAQHFMSLTKCSDSIKKHVSNWDLCETAKATTQEWLDLQLGQHISLPDLIKNHRNSTHIEPFTAAVSCGSEFQLSISQRCELFEHKRVFNLMNRMEQAHLQASMGSSQIWVNTLPLGWKNYNLKPSEWLVSARRRLLLDVRPVNSRCPSCRFHEIGKKGNHAIQCHGAYSTSLRHHAVRNLIAQACRTAGYEVNIEDSGGLNDGRRPGDVRVKRWRLGKDLLIDCAVIDPTVENHYRNLINGPGVAATEYEQIKIDKYSDIDRNKFDFIPFLVETHGTFGNAAIRFCKELHRRKLEKSCLRIDSLQSQNDPISKFDLAKSIAIEVQRWNANMILDRSPRETSSGNSDLSEVAMAVSKWKTEASEKLNRLSERPSDILTNAKEIVSLRKTISKKKSDHEHSHPEQPKINSSISGVPTIDFPQSTEIEDGSLDIPKLSTDSTTTLTLDATPTSFKSVISMKLEYPAENVSCPVYHLGTSEPNVMKRLHPQPKEDIIGEEIIAELPPLVTGIV